MSFKHKNPSDNAPSDTTIRVQNVSKAYQIYERPVDRLKQSIFTRAKQALGLRKKNYYREFWALQDVSFEVKRGETFGIVGRNGAGKSTLLQIICGTLHPTNGTVEINGRVAALLELGSGFNPEFSGRENVYMNAAILGLTATEIENKYDAICEFADIGEFIEQPVKSYSSGMLVRLAFAVIAHVDADILIIDEALAVGDAFFTQKCMRFLRNFMKTGTVLFVSHDTGAVLNLCNQAISLKGGKVSASGDPNRVVETYLEDLYEANRSNPQKTEPSTPLMISANTSTAERRDMRQDFINKTQLRNDIKVFRFDPDKPSFGQSGASIVDVSIFDNDNKALAWVVGGEPIKLVIRCFARNEIQNPIIGFQFKDRLGQIVFGDNTYLTYIAQRVVIEEKTHFQATFEFTMPIVPVGDYSISAAVAEGTQDDHVQHHWIHDALILKVHSTSVSHGLVGIPMSHIELTES